MMKLAGGTFASKVDYELFLAQARDFEKNYDEKALDRFWADVITSGLSHPFPVWRVSEILKWVRSGDYDRIMSGEYRKRTEKANPREEAGAATEFYAERFRSIFREFGEGVGKAGDKAADAADKLAGWLRRE